MRIYTQNNEEPKFYLWVCRRMLHWRTIRP